VTVDRRTFIGVSGVAASAAAARVGLLGQPVLAAPLATEGDDFPLVDLHVHLSDELPIEKALELAEERGATFGIVDHPAPWAIKDDADLRKYVEGLRRYPVYVGLQPMISGWEKAFSPESLAELDYILMDPQTIPLGNGEYQRIWELQTYVEDTEAFMSHYMAHCLNVLEREKIDIFGWPLFLPVCIARDYYTLWTEERMQAILSAARARNIAIEINDMAHTPHEAFIRMARAQGLKFTFGSDSRNANAGRLSYCKSVARRCGLTRDDFYVPVSKGKLGPGRSPQ
jgi:histidinol phosphatase-like PHP family hydrolase